MTTHILTASTARVLARERKLSKQAYDVANAHVHLIKAAGAPTLAYSLAGRLVLSKSGWGLLEVPNSLVRGAFDALQEVGAELPTQTAGSLNAHISVFRPEDIEQIGGPDKLTERGHFFKYTLGPVKEVEPAGWDEMSKVWYIEVQSPELRALRKSYGLSPLPKENKHQFHITIGTRKKKITQDNDVKKAAAEPAYFAPELNQYTDRIKQLMVYPAVRDWFGQHGMMWGGFNDSRNIVDQQREYSQRGNEWKAMQGAASADLPVYKNLLHGMASMAGVPHTPNYENSLNSAAADIGRVSPYFMVFAPNMWDKLHGSRGTAAGLAAGIYRGSQSFPDPVTKQTGYSPETASEMAQGVYNQFYGPGADVSKMQGFSAGDLGQLYESMASRGLMANANDPNAIGSKLQAMVGPIASLRGIGQEMQRKSAASAKGIPDREDYGDLSQLKPGQLLDWITQTHNAIRAGKHEDIRFGNKNTGLFSWVSRKGLPEPGQKRLALQQPVHEHSYKDFEGEIPIGNYGAGTVKKHDEGQVLITDMKPGEIHFTTAHEKYPSRYILKNTDGKRWLMMNATKTEPVPYEKVHYKTIPPDKAEEIFKKLQPGASVQAKIDGAASLTQLYKDHADVFSYRASKKTGGPITHTERLFGGRPKMDIPKQYQGSILRGELYGVKNNSGKPIPVQALGGLLNSSVGKSITDQQNRGQSLRQMLFDVHQLGNKPTTDMPYSERLSNLKDILKILPSNKFHGPEEANTPEAAHALLSRIQAGKHPLSSEGVVIHPATGKPSKVKLREEHDVHLTGTFPGEGKYRNVGAGGFTYALEPGGQTVGRIGTGLSDELRRDAHANPNEYIGRVAKVMAHEKFPSGALRVPALIGLHEDY